MGESRITTCSKCGQQLRTPKNIGGLTMECPECGHRFGSDFRLAGQRRPEQKSAAVTLFELPLQLVEKLLRYLRGKK